MCHIQWNEGIGTGIHTGIQYDATNQLIRSSGTSLDWAHLGYPRLLQDRIKVCEQIEISEAIGFSGIPAASFTTTERDFAKYQVDFQIQHYNSVIAQITSGSLLISLAPIQNELANFRRVQAML
ncbi:hypothetical protein [Gluconobacter kondonii]|uniref:hypothetical protein n=1 Tax=Gluconobacter kondonii TaxID=941463 RepID=UPI001B8CADCE|nr:hypothetical protein [Gluconobacter kondonii]MBS1053708.1 hypothetical protein [Gluconobacter kondonii]